MIYKQSSFCIFNIDYQKEIETYVFFDCRNAYISFFVLRFYICENIFNSKKIKGKAQFEGIDSLPFCF